MTTRYCLKHQLGLCPRECAAEPLAEPLSAPRRKRATGLELRFECADCQMGDLSLAWRRLRFPS